jgi:LysR family transcriptional regulator, nod-box dependent transcriptional activator
MDLQNFDLNLLVALDALLSERSVTNAGRRVHLSQSAMSGALARLRQAFDDELLVAGRGGMTLTPVAEKLVEPVAAILRQVHDTLSTAIQFDPSSSSRLFTIAASDYAVMVFLADFLREMSREAPQVRITIVPMREGMEQLDNPTVDLLILPKAHVTATRAFEPLFTDVFTAIVARDHSRVGTAVTMDDYRTFGHVTVSFADDRPLSLDLISAADAGLQRRVEVVASSYLSLPALVVGTERIATIQRRLALRLAAVHPIKVVPLPVEFPPLEEVMLWHPRFERDPGHVWFRNGLKRAADRLMVSVD